MHRFQCGTAAVSSGSVRNAVPGRVSDHSYDSWLVGCDRVMQAAVSPVRLISTVCCYVALTVPTHISLLDLLPP